MATTSDRMWVGTRKGLLEVRRNGAGWQLEEMKLAGQPIAYACQDPRNGAIWASIDHGHWGCKLHRSTDLIISTNNRIQLALSCPFRQINRIL